MRQIYYEFADGTTCSSYEVALNSGKMFVTKIKKVKDSKPKSFFKRFLKKQLTNLPLSGIITNVKS